MSAPQRVEDHRWEALGFAAQQPGPPIAVPVTKRIAGNALTSSKVLTKIAGSLEGYPSGQRGQTVNLLAYAFGGSNPPPSTIFPFTGSWREKTLHPVALPAAGASRAVRSNPVVRKSFIRRGSSSMVEL